MTDASLHDVLAAAKQLNFTVPPEHETDYLALLRKTDAFCKLVLAEEGNPKTDYQPLPALARFPRTRVHLPKGGALENPLRAWAWRADAGDALDSKGKVLSGKTVVFKDTVCMAGVPLLFGTDAFVDYTPAVDASVVARVLENGGHITGKAACENFSHGPSSSSTPYGPVENPHATGFSAGGSSSGCGALIASGAADMGIGGDQGGSIRIPASLCGIVGLKPTFGLVPYTGVLPSEAGLDLVGPMARTVLDTAALLQAVAGYDGIDDRQLGAPAPDQVPHYPDLVLSYRKQGITGMRIGVLKETFEHPDLVEGVSKLVRAAIEGFVRLGATVGEVSVPTQPLTPALNHIINKFGSGPTRQGRQCGRRGLYLNDFWDQLLPWTQDKYDKAKYYVTGTAMSSEYGWSKYPSAYGRAINMSRKMRDEIDTALGEYDVLVMPTMPQPARRHHSPNAGPLEWAGHAPGATAFTATTNFTGHPALTIPVGKVHPLPVDRVSAADDSILLPVGMMIVGKYWDETTLFRVADAWEGSYDWTALS
ncbi:hypothetical protein JCM24511_05317 [Saitozyma sp. JCM 24511]|nr:hypothetical protein JCM24511_05317 [Saitozyma sp. JCM 24511]